MNPQIQVSKPAITAEEPLLAEIKAFLGAVRGRTVRLFRWRMGGGRWSWGWRFLPRLGGTQGELGCELARLGREERASAGRARDSRRDAGAS